MIATESYVFASFISFILYYSFWLICLKCVKNSDQTDSKSLDFRFWAPDEPNNVDNEDCAEIWGFPGKEFWNDRPCSDKVRWICEKPLFS